jgi:phosphatidylglycerophosphate synthase
MRALVFADPLACSVRVCGLTVLERTLRSLAQAGCPQALVLSSAEAVREDAARVPWPRQTMAVEARVRAGTAAPSAAEVEALLDADELALVVPVEGTWDRRLLEVMLQATTPVALVDSAAPGTRRGALCGPLVLNRAAAPTLDAPSLAVDEGRLDVLDVAMQPDYVPPMRRKVRPVWFLAPTSDEIRRRAERTVLNSAQKGVLDLPAMVHAPIETFLVSLLCRTGITPNQLTVVSALTAWVATFLFATGRLTAGIGVALAVGVLDGLDGKQARVKLETSAVGELEHWSDFFFELSWWAALAWHFHRSGLIPGAFVVLMALYLAEGVDGLTKLMVKRRLGRMIDDLSPAMRVVRAFGGRRNVYAWIMAAGVALGAPAAAYRLLPFWEGVTALVHVAAAAIVLWPDRRRPATAP